MQSRLTSIIRYTAKQSVFYLKIGFVSPEAPARYYRRAKRVGQRVCGVFFASLPSLTLRFHPHTPDLSFKHLLARSHPRQKCGLVCSLNIPLWFCKRFLRTLNISRDRNVEKCTPVSSVSLSPGWPAPFQTSYFIGFPSFDLHFHCFKDNLLVSLVVSAIDYRVGCCISPTGPLSGG